MGPILLRDSLPEAKRLVVASIAAVMVVALGASCHSGPRAADETFEQMVGDAPQAEDDQSNKRRGALWYHIEAKQRRLDIHVRLTDPPERASFFLPGSWAGRSNFADNINIKGAVSEDGPVPFTISRSEGRIDVESKGARWVQLSYAVNLRRQGEALERFHPQFVDGVLFAYGPAFIVLPSEQISRQVRDIPIEVRAPSSWRLLATWKHVTSSRSQAVEDSTVHGFVAATPGALRDAFVAAGASLDVHRPSTDANTRGKPASSIAVGFSPSLQIDRAAYSERIAEIVRTYRRRFGDLGPVTAYVRGVDGPDLDRGRGVGRRGGFVVEIPPDQPLNGMSTLLLAHEAFHLWNGHHLTPKPSAEEQTRWFKEGVTHYVALKALAELGMYSRAEVLSELSLAASYYQRNPAARGGQSTQADRARLPYDKGVLIAIAVDAALSKETAGQVGLEDWLRLLVNKMGDRGNAYDTADLRQALVQVAGSTGAKALDVWDNHITHARPLEPSQIFEAAGLHWLDGDGERKKRLLPIEGAHLPFQMIFPPD